MIEATLIDLSKVYHCLSHDLIVAKFDAYSLDKTGLNLLLDYLISCKQQLLVWPYSKCSNDLLPFIQKSEICNFVDGNTSYSCGQDISDIMRNLKFDKDIF